jgi:tetratricopeptide (TPR) repeat protein
MRKSTNAKIDSLLALSHAEFVAGSLDNAIKYAEEVRRIAEEQGEKSLEALALHRIAGAESERGNHERADELLTIVAERFKADGAEQALAGVWIDQGIVAKGLGRFDLAERLYSKAIEASQKNGWKSVLVSAQGNLAQLARKRGQMDTVVTLLDDVVLYMEANEDWNSLIPMLNILMEVSIETKHHLKLLDVAQKLKAVAQKTDNVNVLAVATANMGHAYNNLHKFQESKAAYQEALEYFRTLDDFRGMSNCCQGLAAVAQIIGTDTEMLAYLYLAQNPDSIEGLLGPKSGSGYKAYER